MLNRDMYDADFFRIQQDGSVRSANVVVPIAASIVRPMSVVDVGCGTGGWLAVFLAHGVRDIAGIDGDYVKASMLRIPQRSFRTADLSLPFDMDRTYDLAVSLEVGEHLPASAASTYVDSLTKLSDAVLFSAAVPFQGGRHHVNEQWPDYWARLFSERDFVCFDCIRRKIWSNPDVQWWYAQNILLFVRASAVSRFPALAGMEPSNPETLPVVHPRSYLLLANDFYGEDGYRDGMIVGRQFTPRR